jgi:lipoprotein-anchoring transpeptidase ErfK/SrfK
MSKRAKQGKPGALDLPLAGRAAIGIVAAVALGYILLSRPAGVQPARRPSTHQVLVTSTPTHAPVHLTASAPALSSGPTSQIETTEPADAPGALVRQVVEYVSNQPPGTIVIDTENTFLYLVLNDTRAMRYGIGVGREGFAWSGEQTVSRKIEWPDWRPPGEMLSRQPYLPRFMAGGPGNPLGARAMYLGETEYRIHGTNKPDTIGKRVSSGCIRLVNEDIVDLYQRVRVGAKVIVLSATDAHRQSQGSSPAAAPRSPNPGPPSNSPATGALLQSSRPKLAEAQ